VGGLVLFVDSPSQHADPLSANNALRVELIRFRIIGTLPLTRLFRKFDPKVGHFQE
jgi:hypothetical protein